MWHSFSLNHTLFPDVASGGEVPEVVTENLRVSIRHCPSQRTLTPIASRSTAARKPQMVMGTGTNKMVMGTGTNKRQDSDGRRGSNRSPSG